MFENLTFLPLKAFSILLKLLIDRFLLSLVLIFFIILIFSPPFNILNLLTFLLSNREPITALLRSFL